MLHESLELLICSIKCIFRISSAVLHFFDESAEFSLWTSLHIRYFYYVPEAFYILEWVQRIDY